MNIDESGRIVAFHEKGLPGRGLINAGVYYVKASVFHQHSPSVFSFEKAFLTEKLHRLAIYGMPTDAYFIDMGIPADLARAQVDLSTVK